MHLSRSSFAVEVDLQTFDYPQEGARINQQPATNQQFASPLACGVETPTIPCMELIRYPGRYVGLWELKELANGSEDAPPTLGPVVLAPSSGFPPNVEDQDGGSWFVGVEVLAPSIVAMLKDVEECCRPGRVVVGAACDCCDCDCERRSPNVEDVENIFLDFLVLGEK